ncbi:hypothetical protein EYF80_043198 [Liparis tanakae]|uniref:Uncharacterized protein n=1 Tax=Liparis tanakae TaxID=230148 RepID=A0A4Z2G031_9TELE|nr:hypothetical protein EYF80_043198 [Liparis tanakae]
MAEEATDLPSGQHSARVRVLVARQHLYPQSLQLGRVERPERDGEEGREESSSVKTALLETLNKRQQVIHGVIEAAAQGARLKSSVHRVQAGGCTTYFPSTASISVVCMPSDDIVFNILVLLSSRRFRLISLLRVDFFVRTCLTSGESKHHDVVKGPAVVRVGGVEGQAAAGLPPQVHQEGAVHHGDGVTAEPLPLPDGLVVRGPLVVALTQRREMKRGNLAERTGGGVGSYAISFKPYLRGDATPEVGVERAGLQHGSSQGQVFSHQQVQHAGVAFSAACLSFSTWLNLEGGQCFGPHSTADGHWGKCMNFARYLKPRAPGKASLVLRFADRENFPMNTFKRPGRASRASRAIGSDPVSSTESALIEARRKAGRD